MLKRGNTFICNLYNEKGTSHNHIRKKYVESFDKTLIMFNRNTMVFFQQIKKVMYYNYKVL